jgi:hypothetical protein
LPVLPIIRPQPVAVPTEQPKAQPSDFGVYTGMAQFGQSLGDLSLIMGKAQAEQDSYEIKRQAVNLDTKLDDLREEVIGSEPDFSKREKLYQEKATEYLQQTTTNIDSPAVKNGLERYYSVKFPMEAHKFRVDNLKDWGKERIAQLGDLGDLLSDKIISTDDPQEAAKYTAMYKSQATQLSEGPYAPLDAEGLRKANNLFENKVYSKQALAMIGRDAQGFLNAADEGQFNTHLTEDQIYKFRGMARQKIDQDEKAQDKVTKDVKELVTNGVQAKANLGQLTANEQNALLNGTYSNYITAKEGHALVETNSHPVTGAGSTQAQAIMSRYYLGPRTIPRINATRQELQHLQAELGQPDPFVMKFANELQSDQTAMENQGIARENVQVQRENQDIKHIQTNYEADKKDIPKPLEKILGNKDQQNKAKIEQTYRKQGPEAARNMAESLAKGQNQKASNIPEAQKKVLGVVK